MAVPKRLLTATFYLAVLVACLAFVALGFDSPKDRPFDVSGETFVAGIPDLPPTPFVNGWPSPCQPNTNDYSCYDGGDS